MNAALGLSQQHEDNASSSCVSTRNQYVLSLKPQDKVEGEIGIFRRVGRQPGFFAETLIGTKLPNLTYMVTFENLTARARITGPRFRRSGVGEAERHA